MSRIVGLDSPLDPDLITPEEPSDWFCLHPINEIEPPRITVELCGGGHIETSHLIQLESCRPFPNPLTPIPPAALHIVTPLLPRRWEELLHQHPDQPLAAYIVKGLSGGFHIGYEHDRSVGSSASANMLSAVRNPVPVEQYLSTELAAGRIAGPFLMSEVPWVHVSRFGVIPKNSRPGEWRLILGLSFPPHGSVNDGIDPEMCSVRYPTVDQAIARIVELRPGALLAKVDVAHAFRNIPVHPDDRHLLGMCWGNKVYIDLTLPFGLRSSPKIFTAVADALEWIFLHLGVSWSTHYMDDFLTMGQPDTTECRENLNSILRICEWLGVPLKAEKIEGPASVLTFLGITLDTELREIRLPEKKLEDLKSLLGMWKTKKACKKRELLSLVGKLSHACKVVQAGWIFLRRMIDQSMKARHPDHWIKLDTEFRADLAWWEAFLPIWNARSMMDIHNPKWVPSVTFSSDASGSWGCGAVWQQAWLQQTWDEEWKPQNIAAKELVPIAVACAVWGPDWRHQRVLVQCDNMAVVQVITAKSSRGHTLMHLLRCIHFFCAVGDFKLRAEHISGCCNTPADAVSRNHLQVFFEAVPQAHRLPVPVPAPLWNFLTSQQPEWRSPAWREWLRTSSQTAWHQAPARPTRPASHSLCSSATN